MQTLDRQTKRSTSTNKVNLFIVDSLIKVAILRWMQAAYGHGNWSDTSYSSRRADMMMMLIISLTMKGLNVRVYLLHKQRDAQFRRWTNISGANVGINTDTY